MNVNSQRASLRLDLATSHIRQKERPLLTYGLLASTPIAIDPRSALSVQSYVYH